MTLSRKLIMSATLLVPTLLVYFVMAQRLPMTADDYSYLYQAKLFASGKLYAEDRLYDPGLPFHDCLQTSCMKDDQGHRFSKYAPGWPLILSVGVKLGVPWIVDPLLGVLLFFLMLRYTERRLGEKSVRVVYGLVLLCFFFAYYAASVRAHFAAAIFIFGAFLLYDSSHTSPESSKLRLLTAGALLGCSAMIRYIDWIPLAIWIGVGLLRRKRFADLLLFGIGFALFASGNLVYNKLLTGDPFIVPAGLYHSPSDTSDRLLISLKGFSVTAARLATLVWVFPPVLLLGVLWKHYSLSPTMKMCLALFAMNVAVYFLYPNGIGVPGPRYFLAYFPFLVLAIADLYRLTNSSHSPIARWFWNLAIAAQVVCSIVFAWRGAHIMYARRDLERTVQRVQGGKNIFLLKPRVHHTGTGDLTRNPPALASAENLFFKWCDQPARDALLQFFPGRRVFIYEYPGHLSPYALTSDAGSTRR